MMMAITQPQQEEEEQDVVGGTGEAGGVAPRSPVIPAGANGAPPNCKRLRSDAAEWSESAINALLDAFGSRYIASHRGNLRGKDWDDVTRAVNASGVTGSKSVEQCRNKIDNLKKRFKLEREKGNPASSWPWFRTLDSIVGRAPKRSGATGVDGSGRPDPDMKISLPGIRVLPPQQEQQLEHEIAAAATPQPGGEAPEDSDPDNVAETPFWSQRDGHTDPHVAKGGRVGKDGTSEMTTNNPNPASASNGTGPGKPMNRKKRKNVCQAGKDVAASIASFGEVFAKIEFAKMELFKDIEMRRLDMQFQLAKMAQGKKKNRTNSMSSGSD